MAHYSDGENDFIALEDLSFKNYGSVERGEGLDLNRTMKVIDVFAKFHAVSLAFKDQKPAEFMDAASSLKVCYSIIIIPIHWFILQREIASCPIFQKKTS